MRRLSLVLAVAVAACHPGSTVGTEHGGTDELVGTWGNACTCLHLGQPGTLQSCTVSPGDLCADRWDRLSEELLIVDQSKTVQAELSGDTLDLYWESDAGVKHLGLVKADGGCP